MGSPIHITSEIGKLESVILKRPGHEVENITPDTMERLLFDDIPYLPIAQEEHDFFADTLRQNGIEVLYLEKLAAEAVADPEVKDQFLEQMISESGYLSGPIHDALKEYLLYTSQCNTTGCFQSATLILASVPIYIWLRIESSEVAWDSRKPWC